MLQAGDKNMGSKKPHFGCSGENVRLKLRHDKILLYLIRAYTATKTIAGAAVYAISDVANAVWSTIQSDQAPARWTVMRSQGNKA
jgi:hypothetical protein